MTLPSNLQYLNISNRYNPPSIADKVEYNTMIYGLTHLEVLDLSRMGLMFVNLTTFQFMPSLRVLNLANNYFIM